MKRIVLPLALIASLALAGTATAAPSVTPAGFTGACNMLRSWPGVGPGVPDGRGMERAMTVDNANGNTGMWGAVYNTTGNTPEDGCK